MVRRVLLNGNSDLSLMIGMVYILISVFMLFIIRVVYCPSRDLTLDLFVPGTWRALSAGVESCLFSFEFRVRV